MLSFNPHNSRWFYKCSNWINEKPISQPPPLCKVSHCFTGVNRVKNWDSDWFYYQSWTDTRMRLTVLWLWYWDLKNHKQTHKEDIHKIICYTMSINNENSVRILDRGWILRHLFTPWMAIYIEQRASTFGSTILLERRSKSSLAFVQQIRLIIFVGL